MSADYSTEHYKGWHHRRDGHDWIHVAHRREDSGVVGDFGRTEIAELVELAEQAWPGLAEDLADAASRVAAAAKDDETAAAGGDAGLWRVTLNCGHHLLTDLDDWRVGKLTSCDLCPLNDRTPGRPVRAVRIVVDQQHVTAPAEPGPFGPDHWISGT